MIEFLFMNVICIGTLLLWGIIILATFFYTKKPALFSKVIIATTIFGTICSIGYSLIFRTEVTNLINDSFFLGRLGNTLIVAFLQGICIFLYFLYTSKKDTSEIKRKIFMLISLIICIITFPSFRTYSSPANIINDEYLFLLIIVFTVILAIAMQKVAEKKRKRMNTIIYLVLISIAIFTPFMLSIEYSGWQWLIPCYIPFIGQISCLRIGCFVINETREKIKMVEKKGNDLTSRLQVLAQQHADGQISDEEFATLKASLLQSL